MFSSSLCSKGTVPVTGWVEGESSFAMLACTYSRSCHTVLSAAPSVVSARFRMCMTAYRKNRGGGLSLVGEGCCGRVSVFQVHTQQNRLLSRGTIRSPVAVHGCWTCFLPFSLLSISLLPSFFRNLFFFLGSVQTQIPATILAWQGRKCFDGDDRRFCSSMEKWQINRT